MCVCVWWGGGLPFGAHQPFFPTPTLPDRHTREHTHTHTRKHMTPHQPTSFPFLPPPLSPPHAPPSFSFTAFCTSPVRHHSTLHQWRRQCDGVEAARQSSAPKPLVSLKRKKLNLEPTFRRLRMSSDETKISPSLLAARGCAMASECVSRPLQGFTAAWGASSGGCDTKWLLKACPSWSWSAVGVCRCAPGVLSPPSLPLPKKNKKVTHTAIALAHPRPLEWVRPLRR